MKINIELDIPVIAQFIPYEVHNVSRKPIDLYLKKHNGIYFYFGITNGAMMHNLVNEFLTKNFIDVMRWIHLADIVIAEYSPGVGKVIKSKNLHYEVFGEIIQQFNG
jgi:hypothetical protein